MHPLTVLVSAFALAINAVAFRFTPENLTLLAHDESSFPKVIDLPASQTLVNVSNNDWYSTSYIRSSTDGRQYLILSQTLTPQLHRSSMLDITDPTADGAYWSNVSLGAAPPYNIDGFNITYPDGVYVFESLSNDSLSVLHTKQVDPTLSFDITFQSSSPVLLNGGLGSLALSTTRGQVRLSFSVLFPNSEPSADAEHHLRMEHACRRDVGVVHLEGSKARYRYDEQLYVVRRQWGGVLPRNWTWFGLHIGSPEDEAKSKKVSFWAIDQTDSSLPRTQFATVRRVDGVHMVVPATWSSSDIWTSPTSGNAYPQQYKVTWPDGSVMKVTSVRDDQELVAGPGPSYGFEGYATVSGEFLGEPISGFGIIEINNFAALE